ncbi:hypothetical protein [Methylomonas koyamae]|uniref:hypothetical protein n=1 Tax=Methylomonas koyamae TaxID=702114 RepID=UPI0006CF487E|nr:hypothetical protein [Methylomonas koyamae]BBL58643.1 hypothetical protein MKFW12EY_22560 [Methylomonas koyamae]
MTDVCVLSGQAYTVTEWPGLTQAVCESSAGVWQAWPTSLETLFTTYFAFDADFFQTILGNSLIAFALGLSAGTVVSIMRRT